MRISLLLLTLALSSAQAQRSPVGLYFQFAGEGLGLSANLDVGVTQSLRLRGGAGWVWTVGTVPLSASYLISKKNSTIEVGAGATVIFFLHDDHSNDGTVNDFFEKIFFLEGQKNRTIPMGILGWRYHPRSGAILRLTLNPMLFDDRFHLYGGASIGVGF